MFEAAARSGSLPARVVAEVGSDGLMPVGTRTDKAPRDPDLSPRVHEPSSHDHDLHTSLVTTSYLTTYDTGWHTPIQANRLLPSLKWALTSKNWHATARYGTRCHTRV